MTLFGVPLEGQQLFSLVSLLLVLALWIVILVRERRYVRWMRRQHPSQPKPGPSRSTDEPKGPWG